MFSWRTLCCSDDVGITKWKMVLPSRLCPLPADLPEDIWGPVILLHPQLCYRCSVGSSMELFLEVLLQQVKTGYIIEL